MSAEPLKQFRSALKAYVRTLPRVIGKAVLEESANNFRQQGAETEQGQVVPWAPRKVTKEHGRTRKDGGRDRRYKNPRQRAILVKTGRLRRSVRIVATTATSVTVGSSEPYAEPQQDGNSRGLRPRPFITLGRSGQQKLVRKISGSITSLLR
jgi:phage gpG-like protein